MAYPYSTLDEVTGLGKIIATRDKYTGDAFAVGPTEGEVSVSGENKYFIQQIRLDGSQCASDVGSSPGAVLERFKIGHPHSTVT